MKLFELIDVIESNPAIYGVLKTCPYYILKQWEICHFSKGSSIGRQGQADDSFGLIVSGWADIYVMGENGKRYSQAIYTAGNYIGELEIFERRPFTCSVEALTDVILLRLKRSAFLEWLDLDKNAGGFLLRTLCSQFYHLSQKAGQDTLYSLRQRLCRYLLEAKAEGREKPEGIEIHLNKEALGEQLAVTGRSINRMLQYLVGTGVIAVNGSRILLKDLTSLAAQAHQPFE